jgi:hypothetical protein
MKTKVLKVTLQDGYRNHDPNNLLITDMGVMKDIVKDIISVIPNILPLEKFSIQISENYKDGKLKGNLTAYTCFDMYRIEHSFLEIEKRDVNYVKTNDDGTTGNPVPMIIYTLLADENDPFAESLFQMVENYYRGKSSAVLERSSISDNDTINENIPMIVSNVDDLDSFSNVHPAAVYGLKNRLDNYRAFSAFTFPKDSANLDGKKAIDIVTEIIRSKFSVIIPVKTEMIKSDEGNAIRKTFLDFYDVYAMDTRIGKLFTLVSCTSSTIGKESNVRNGVVDHSVVILWSKDPIKDYAINLGKDISNRFIESAPVGSIVTDPD